MISLAITLRELRGALRAIQEDRLGGRLYQLPLHLSRFQDSTEFLAHPGTAQSGEGTLLVWPVAEEAAPVPHDWTLALQRDPERPLVGLGIGVGAQQGRVAGRVRLDPDRPSSDLERMRIVGPQMPTMNLIEIEDKDKSNSENRSSTFRPIWVTADGLYSRLVGTMGLRTFARLQSARIAVIGAGGNGSLLAEQLARWMGRDGRLGLIDADRLALYNLPAWSTACGQDAQKLPGRSKVEALADQLRTLPDPPQIEAVVASVLDWTALAALKRYDLFVCCVDNPTARYAATFLATLYLRPLLDVATGIFLGKSHAEHAAKLEQEDPKADAVRALFRHARLPNPLMEPGERSMGADVRLIIPGSDSGSGDCLLCQGGVGDLNAVRTELEASPQTRTTPESRPGFWRGRAGSLSVLNSDAVNQALRMLIAFLEGEIGVSEHWQMDQTLTTPPVWQRLTYEATTCSLCAIQGAGDSGLKRMVEVLRRYS